jgi:hypothetical protein
MPRDFLFGMIRVPMWDYYWELTAAQVELLTIDQPFVAYKADKDNDKPWKNGRATQGYAKSQYDKWLEKKKKREAEGKNLDITQVQQGRRIDFQHFVETGEKKDI